MSTSKHIDSICIASVALILVLSFLILCVYSPGAASSARTMNYEHTLFNTSYVHKIDIVMDNWNSFLESCMNEEYHSCTVVIDGRQHKNTAIRAKGNTSLSSVSALGSQRYSFKLEFDHYESGRTCDGLDKLCLNNLIQDNTMMKDYLVYQMMNTFGVDSPLCSFAYVTVNGEDWGLYLAVEGVEDSFLSRNYGTNPGELYKPDSMGFGGGRGNGKDFRMDEFDFENAEEPNFSPPTDNEKSNGGMPQMPPDEGLPGGFPQIQAQDNEKPDDMPQMPDGFDGGMPGRMGSDDVKLKYIDDNPSSYANIFENAKTEISNTDKKRLISALKNLSDYSDLENTLDMEEVLRYFVVHNFVCNGDSYTGNMIHNYYLHEKDGKLSMIPWDYNLAFGTFQSSNATGAVNSSIDSPVSGGSMDDRPMVGWIFSNETYTSRYHELFSSFMETWLDSGKLASLVETTAEMLHPYVEKDPTKFCTEEEFNTGVRELSHFVALRAEAVRRQLAGDDSPVDTSELNLSAMGTMNNRMGRGMNPDFDPFSAEGENPRGAQRMMGRREAGGFHPWPEDRSGVSFENAEFG